MHRHFSALAMVGLAATAIAACGLGQMPGTQLGTFEVTAQAQTNSCGLGAPNPWDFDVQLSQDGSTLYWNWMDGSAYLSGPVANQAVTLTASEQGNVDGTADGGLGPCTMQRYDTITVTLGTGTSPTVFSGTISYAISAAEGADCTDQLTANGGQYTEIPCSMEYTMTAAKQ